MNDAAGVSSFDWALPYPSRRQPILARNAVATSQPLATQAGIAMLQRGGNAVDAALATAISLTVLEPCSNGIGSDLFERRRHRGTRKRFARKRRPATRHEVLGEAEVVR